MVPLNTLILLINPVFTLFLFGYVFGQRLHNRLNRAFLALVGTFLLITLGEFLMRVSSAQPVVIRSLIQITTSLFFISSFAFLNFIYAFTKRKPDRAYYVFAVMCVICFLLPLLNISMHKLPYNYSNGSLSPLPNALFSVIFLLFNTPVTLYGIGLAVFSFFKEEDPIQKKRLKIWLVGLGVAFIYVLLITFIFPVLFHDPEISAYGSLSIIIIDLFAYWAVRRHNFLTVNVRQLEEILEKIFGTSNDAIFLLNNKCRIVKTNQAAMDAFEFNVKSIDSFFLTDFVPHLATDAVLDHTEIEMQIANKKHIFLITKTDLIAADETIHFLVFMRDITNSKKAAEEQLRTQQLESLGVLAGGIAHDFNNLLCGVVSSLGFVKTVVDQNSEAGNILAEAERTALSARGLTRQLITFAKGGAPVLENVDIGNIISDTCKFAMSGSTNKLEIQMPDTRLIAHVDAGQIRQVFHNLILNANQAMTNGGVIRVSGVTKQLTDNQQTPPVSTSHLEVKITDQGCGMSPEVLSRIYEPYYSTKKGNSGLGLTVVFAITKRHKGSVNVVSEEGKGTEFTVTLPLTFANEENEQAGTPEVSEKKKGRILIMDDVKVVRLTLRVLLQNLGMEVEEAEDGETAFAKFIDAKSRNNPFFCVITDLTVPGGMCGKQLARKIRDCDEQVHIVVSSGYSSEIELTHYKDFGFTAVLPKPYNIKELRKAISC